MWVIKRMPKAFIVLFGQTLWNNWLFRNHYIKIYLEKENSGSYSKIFGPSKFKGISKTSDLGTPKGSMVLAKVTNKKSIIENYRLKVWLSSTASPGTIPQNYSIDINLVGDAE